MRAVVLQIFSYPTWGDIIAYDKLRYKGYDLAFNLGVNGGCNQLIASRLAWADTKYKFTDQDDIAILWTTLFRESVLTTWFDNPSTQWHTLGFVFNNPFWSDFDRHAYLHNTYNMLDRNMSTFHYVNKLYKPFYQGKIKSRDEEDSYNALLTNDVVDDIESSEHDQVLRDFYNQYQALDNLYFTETQSKVHVDIFGKHPTLREHLRHAQKISDLDSNTVTYFENMSDKLDHQTLEVYHSMDDIVEIKLSIYHYLQSEIKDFDIRGMACYSYPDYT